MTDESSSDRDRLATYRGIRNPNRTPEPVPPAGPLPEGDDNTFVIQEHHARRLHWDVRLERSGVLVSWAVPRGLPLDPADNHLAVHTEDHPLEYASFAGQIPPGEYGGGTVILWDRGRYEVEKWTDREVKVVLHGTRIDGRYVFFQTRGTDWMVHRMDLPPDPEWRPVPIGVYPMLPVRGELPPRSEDPDWAYEMDWDGVPAILTVEGGRARITVDGADATGQYPELRAIGDALGSRAVVLRGTVVALGSDGRPDAERLRRRRERTAASVRAVRSLAAELPVTLLASDLLYVDGMDLRRAPFRVRREQLDRLDFVGLRWGTSPLVDGSGSDALTASRELRLPGVIAMRWDAPYRSGQRSSAFRQVGNQPVEEVAVGGWVPAAQHPDEPEALLVGVRSETGLHYRGTVRTGLTARRRADLAARLPALARKTSPFGSTTPERVARWVRPTLIGRVAVLASPDGGSGRLAWRGLLPD